MTSWIGFTNPKDVFEDKEEFQQFQWLCREFNVQWIKLEE